MTRKLAIIVVMLAFLFVATIGIISASAQQATPASTISTPTPTPDFEGRISNLENRASQLEAAQAQSIESLKSSAEQNKVLLTALGAFVGILVAIQGFTSYAQIRREGKRDDFQGRRDVERDQLEHAGVKQVSEIMQVVRDTLESRLDAEKQAREEAAKARMQLDKFSEEIKSLDRFVHNFQTIIQNARNTIEETASRWAQEVSRHDFRRMTSELNAFAQQFDTFINEYKALEEEPHPQFSARVFYIRGIAAHYSNQPEVAKQYLTQVAGFQHPESGETEIAHNRRVANAYYYLGLNESNFGNMQEAIDSFDNANRRDLQGRDFLTRVVTAEAYILAGDFDKGHKFLVEVEEGINTLEGTEGHLRSFHLRLRSRSTLLRANMAILRHANKWWEEVQQLLEPIHIADPQYYYVTATLAQVYASQGNHDKAQNLFREAYDTIERSGDFQTVMEARSQILLRMVAGLCCKNGIDEKRAEEHLDRADRLRDSLPKIGPRTCTVFSNLSKKNENSETIHHHIEMIRQGTVLL